MDKLFIDYETFWGTKYSLRTAGMSYTDYILHEKFQIHGASVAFNDEEPTWCDAVELHYMFKSLKESGDEIEMICHNALFDGIITYMVFGYSATKYFCTLAMVDAEFQGGIGRGLDECMKVLLSWEQGRPIF